MANIFDRLASGPGSTQPQDYDDWNQMVGSAPPGKFSQAATGAVRQLPAEEYYQHSQPGVNGTDPYGQLPKAQRGGLAGSLLDSLLNRGVSKQQVQREAGLSTLDPKRMTPEQIAQLTQWMQRNHPEALGQAAQQYQDKPDMLQSLLGNKALQLLAVGLGAKILMDHRPGR